MSTKGYKKRTIKRAACQQGTVNVIDEVIRVLRAPDERLDGLVDDAAWEDGDLVIIDNGSYQTSICHEHQPALLASLLENATLAEAMPAIRTFSARHKFFPTQVLLEDTGMVEEIFHYVDVYGFPDTEGSYLSPCLSDDEGAITILVPTKEKLG